MEVANQNRLKFLDRNFKRKSKTELVEEYLFYFAIQRERINFLLFDCQLNCVEFSTDNILNLQKSDPEHFEAFK